MWDLKACTVCFGTGIKLYSLNVGTLRNDFNLISGLKMMQGNGMPEYLCVECSAYVRKFKTFRDRCHRAHYVLELLLVKNKEIKKSNMSALNRQQLNLMPSLNYIDLDNAHYEQVKFKLVNYCRTSISQLGFIPVAHYSTLTKEDTFESEMKVLSNNKMQEVKVEIEPAVQSDVAVNKLSQETNIKDTPEIQENDNDSSVLGKLLEARPDFPSCIFNTGLDCSESNAELNLDTFDHDDIVGNAYESDNEDNKFELLSCKLNNKRDGFSSVEEYGDVVPISVKEAKAALEVFKFTSTGRYQCHCGKRFSFKHTIKRHSRRHDQHISGNFRCEICDYHFKTMFLLECHMKDHHMYKYLCKKCPEVSFTKPAAKHHYVWRHIQLGRKGDGNQWSQPEKPPRVKSKPKKAKKVPKDFPLYTPISQEEQYAIVAKRKESRNYLEAKYKCELCYRGYRHTATYDKHMAKHNPKVSGIHQCDMCKLYFRDTRRLYKHMNTYHLFNYSCRYCEFVCTNKGQALYHYRFHKNVTYDCPHCDKKFNKISTRLTHIRYKHPGTDICNLCGHSFVSSSGLNCHKQMSHTKEELKISEAMAEARTPTEPFYCAECSMQFVNEQAYITHLGSSRNHVQTNLSIIQQERTLRREERQTKSNGCRPRAAGSSRAAVEGDRAADRTAAQPRPRGPRAAVLNTGAITATVCEVCGVYLPSDVATRRHYEAEHPGTDYLKRYMCDVCGHTTKQYANLLVHMRVHTQEKPYACPHCERRFSMPSNRDRHLVVHTGEKRFQCQHCFRRFTQSTAVKLHIQTVHMKIPYKPWDKKNRKRRKDAEPTTQGVEVAPLPEVATALAPEQKILLEPHGAYLTYIAYEDEQ